MGETAPRRANSDLVAGTKQPTLLNSSNYAGDTDCFELRPDGGDRPDGLSNPADRHAE
mgnify:CR=1 FL=1